jgi:hypothetical protein
MIQRVFRLLDFPLILAPFVLLAPVYLTGRALFWGTPLLQFIPWRSWAWETLRSGNLPLWNPLLGMGAPLVANYQSGLFYPPNWFFFLLAELGGTPFMAWGQALIVAMHLAWAALGMARLARSLGLNDLAQTISGLAFSLSGYLVARSGFLSINAAIAWLPWILLYLHKLEGWQDGKLVVQTSRAKVANFLVLSVLIGIQLLAGHAQTTWYSLVLALLWAGFWATRKRNSFVAQARGLLYSWTWSGMALLLGLALAAVQLFPTAEYLLASQRAAELDYEYAMTYSYWPWRFLTFLAPNLFGDPVTGDYWGYGNFWEDAVYIGMLPLLLALGAASHLLKSRSLGDQKFLTSATGIPLPSLTAFLGILFALACLLALGNNTSIYPWLYRNVPTFAMFQAPARLMLWGVFSLALLAGLGANSWRRPSGRALYWLRLGIVGSVAVMIGAVLAWLFLEKVNPSFIRATALAGVWGIGACLLSLLAPFDVARQPQTASAVYHYKWQWAVSLFVAVDLVFAGWGLNPASELDLYQETALTAEDVRSLVGEGRVYLPVDDEHTVKFEKYFRFDTFTPQGNWLHLRAALLPDINMLDGIPFANNFDPLVPGRFSRWMQALSQSDPEIQGRLLNLMSVSVVERVDESYPYGIRFESLETLPRLRWVPCARPARDGEDALQQVLQGELDFGVEVVLEEVDAFQGSACNGVEYPIIQKKSEDPNRFTVGVQAVSPGYLVIADVWYPGWQARVDDEQVKVLRANYLFRAVSVPAGEHEVQLVYRPVWFYLGAAVSLAAWIGVLLFLLLQVRVQKPGEQ